MNTLTGIPVDITVPWQDCQKQPPEELYKKAILKNFAISMGNTWGLFLKKFIKKTLSKRDPNRGVFL